MWRGTGVCHIPTSYYEGIILLYSGHIGQTKAGSRLCTVNVDMYVQVHFSTLT